MPLPDTEPGILDAFVIDWMNMGKIQKQPHWLPEGYIFAVDYRVLGLRDHIVRDFYSTYVWGDRVKLPAYQLVSRAFRALSPERILTTQVATVFTVRDSQMVKVSAKGGIYNAAFSPTFGNGEGAPDAADHAHGITIKLQKELGPGFTSGHVYQLEYTPYWYQYPTSSGCLPTSPSSMETRSPTLSALPKFSSTDVYFTRLPAAQSPTVPVLRSSALQVVCRPLRRRWKPVHQCFPPFRLLVYGYEL
ncbi:hypothetical protein DIS24_g4320 [Lasiodiplodia hormozganensis]|uniref:Uncharacterized protein n=1 Tax=Lasiodiplodia hormozganensis TaxID=869390 RepID=A0AA39YVX8_9PEZI|nr:hypothetical protein DIS24_g4320 [Lasiodiplodia hormozganensis]